MAIYYGSDQGNFHVKMAVRAINTCKSRGSGRMRNVPQNV